MTDAMHARGVGGGSCGGGALAVPRVGPLPRPASANGPLARASSAAANALEDARDGSALVSAMRRIPSYPLLAAPAPLPTVINGNGCTGGGGGCGSNVPVPVGSSGCGPAGMLRSSSSSGGSTSAHTSGVGTASYSAPEQLGDGRTGGGKAGGVAMYGPEVDIFPLGGSWVPVYRLRRKHGLVPIRTQKFGTAPPGECARYCLAAPLHSSSLRICLLASWPCVVCFFRARGGTRLSPVLKPCCARPPQASSSWSSAASSRQVRPRAQGRRGLQPER